MSNNLAADITDYLAFYPCERETIVEYPLAESLWRIVRRILRTQSKRTSFEVRVLGEARRLANGQFEGFTRDVLAKLVVDQLLTSRHVGHSSVNTSGSGQDQFSAQVLLSSSALAR